MLAISHWVPYMLYRFVVLPPSNIVRTEVNSHLNAAIDIVFPLPAIAAHRLMCSGTALTMMVMVDAQYCSMLNNTKGIRTTPEGYTRKNEPFLSLYLLHLYLFHNWRNSTNFGVFQIIVRFFSGYWIRKQWANANTWNFMFKAHTEHNIVVEIAFVLFYERWNNDTSCYNRMRFDRRLNWTERHLNV